MPDIKIAITLTASLKAMPKGFVLDDGAAAVSRFDMKTLTLRGKVGKRVRLVKVNLVEAT